MTIPPLPPIEGPLSPLTASGGEGATAPAGGEGSFGAVLKNALNQLESGQRSAAAASVEVATGTTANPEQAIVEVQNGLLEMELASALRNKATEAINQLMQTQV